MAPVMRNQVQLQQRGSTTDDHGQRALTWTTVATVWAAIAPTAGRELQAAGAQQGEGLVTMLIRYRTGITIDMRALWRGQPYTLTAPPEDIDGARRWLRLRCSAGVQQA